jgi:hypothetical protein
MGGEEIFAENYSGSSPGCDPKDTAGVGRQKGPNHLVGDACSTTNSISTVEPNKIMAGTRYLPAQTAEEIGGKGKR